MNEEHAFAVELPARPYPGLRPFDTHEWPIFFGRERMVDAVVGRLVAQHFIAVHGDSGSGKSSLIRAGVLPRLVQEQARGGVRWRTCIAQPGDAPLRNIARALARLDGREDDAEHLLALRRALNQCQRAPAALAALLLQGEHEHVCLLIDQFEEIFEAARRPGGQGHDSEARILADALVALAAEPVPGLYVALTMRSEFLGACARFPGLAEAVNLHQYLLPPMRTDDLLRAIREPALLFGGEIDLALAERLAADAQATDGLPLVQHALMLMHREAGAVEPWRLAAERYPAEGLPAMLSRHADAVAAEIAHALPQSPRLVEDLFRALSSVTAEGHAVRRPQPLARLAAVCDVTLEAATTAVDGLRADGVSFLTPRPGRPLGPDESIDIGHEALIRGWQALAEPRDGWLAREFRNGLVWRSMLVQADSFEREPKNVLSEATTEERARWMLRRNAAWAERYGGGWERVQALLAASVQAAEAQAAERTRHRKSEMDRLWQARRLRKNTVLGIAATVVFGGLAVAGFSLRNDAVEGRRAAEAAQRLAEERAVGLELASRQTASSYRNVLSVQGELDKARQSRSEGELRQYLDNAAQKASGAASGLQQTAASLKKY